MIAVKRPKLTIINIYQLGYHTDTYNYCYHLRNEYNITYVSFNQGFPELKIENVECILIPQPVGFLNLISGYISLAKITKNLCPDIVFIVYVRFISIIKFFLPGVKIILDIRTGSLKEVNLYRNFWNYLLRIEARHFKYVTIISEGLRNKLRLPARKCNFLPLGGNLRIFKRSKEIRSLLYVGTFDQRNLNLTIEGFNLFIKRYSNDILKYNIVGYGKKHTEELLSDTIRKLNIEDRVTLFGRVPYDELDPFLMEANVGIVFLPVTDYYNYQPSTKLFEFLLAGIPILATRTAENILIVKSINGILIDDTPESFCKGLRYIFEHYHLYDSSNIQNTVSDYTWESIVQNHLKPVLINTLND